MNEIRIGSDRFDFVCDIRNGKGYAVYLYSLEKKDFSSFYIFYEFDKSTYVVTEISFSEIDLLNRGIISIKNCFSNPFGRKREGYIIKESKGIYYKEEISDVSQYFPNIDCYAIPLVDDNHGVGLLSFIYKKSFLSFVIDKGKFVSPTYSGKQLAGLIDNVRLALDQLPNNSGKSLRLFFSTSHSITCAFEIEEEDDQLSLLKENCNAFIVANLLTQGKTISEEQLVSIKNKDVFLTQLSRVAQSLKDNVKQDSALIQVVTFDKGNNKVEKKLDVQSSKEYFDDIERRANSIKEEINLKNAKEYRLKLVGFFELFETTGKKRFRLNTTINGEKTTISGHCSFELSDRKIDLYVNNKETNYIVDLNVKKGESKRDDEYTIIDLELNEKFEQLSIIDEPK